MATTPSWVKDARFYQIFPDRFRRTPVRSLPAVTEGLLEPWDASPTTRGFKGGTLDGIIEGLGYIQETGFNALYLTPTFASSANHRYHTTDYLNIDPLLGGNQAMRRLIDAVHDHGMHLILDGVFNHSGRGFYAFNSLLENGERSPYRDWYHVYRFPLNAFGGRANYACWWNNPELPKFNIATPEVREYLFSVGEYWIHFGADGWRLDVPNEIDDDGFWQSFRSRVKEANPEAYIVGEIWGEAGRWLRGDQFDAVTNYQLARAVLAFAGDGSLDRGLAAQSGLGQIEQLQALAFSHRLEDLFSRYDWSIVISQMNLLGSHDTPRLLEMLGGNVERAALALKLLFTLPGAPTVYYGDEIGMLGRTDPDNRRSFPWDRGVWQVELRETVQKLSSLRERYPELREGRYQRLYAQDGRLAFARRLENRPAVLVTVNHNDQTWRPVFDAPGCLAPGHKLVEHLQGLSGSCTEHRFEAGTAQLPYSLAIWGPKSG